MKMNEAAPDGDIGWLRPYLEGERSFVRLKNGVMKASPMNAKLIRGQWSVADQVVITHSRRWSPVVTRLMELGLVKSDWGGVSPLQVTEAECRVAVDPKDRSKDILESSLPLPRISCRGKPELAWLEGIQEAAVKVGIAIEKMALGTIPPPSAPIVNPITPEQPPEAPKLAYVYGLLSHPDRFTVSGNYDPLMKPGRVVSEVSKAKKMLAGEQYFGPYILIYSAGENGRFQAMMEHGLAATLMEEVGDIKECIPSEMPPNRAVLLHAGVETFQMLNLLAPTPIQWEDGFMVIAVLVPQIRKCYGRSDAGTLGIVDLSWSW